MPLTPGASYLFPCLYLLANSPALTVEWESSGACGPAGQAPAGAPVSQGVKHTETQ